MALLLSLALVVTGCQFLGIGDGQAVATVNGENITRGEWLSMVQERMRQVEDQERQRALQELINFAVVRTAAAREGVEVPQADLDQRIELAALQLGGDVQALEEYLVSLGFTLRDLEEQFRFELYLEGIALARANVSEEEARAHFEADPGSYLPPGVDPAEVNVEELDFETVAEMVYADLALQQVGGVDGLLAQLHQEAEIEILVD